MVDRIQVFVKVKTSVGSACNSGSLSSPRLVIFFHHFKKIVLNNSKSLPPRISGVIQPREQDWALQSKLRS